MSSLETALKIVSLLSRERPVLRVGEVCRELDVPKSTVSRLLKTLADYGILERDGRDPGYVAGHQTLALADLYLANRSLLDLVDGALDRLIAEFQFGGYIAVLSGAEITALRQKSGTYPLRVVHAVGKRMPAFSSALGRSLLARETDDFVVSILPQELQAPFGREGILKEMAKVRLTGTVTVASDAVPGISALGAAIHDPDKGEKMAFSISYPNAAVDEELHARMVRRVREEARAIGIRVGDGFWSNLAAGDVDRVPAAPSEG